MKPTLHERVGSVRGIVFDLFHTLTAKESEWWEGPYTFEALGVSRDDWKKQIFESSRSRLAGEARDPRVFISQMARSIDPSIVDEVVDRAVENRLWRFSEALRKIPGENVVLLEALRSRSIKLGLVSNADCGEIAAWNSCALAPCFDSTVFSCHVGYVKPEPEIFLHCLGELGLPAEECLFVGDGGSRELSAARRLGFTTVMVAGLIEGMGAGEIGERTADADYVIAFPNELLPS